MCTAAMHRDPQSRTATAAKFRQHSYSNRYRKNTKTPIYGAFGASTQVFISIF
jgi:hypothetical protein